MPRLIFLIFLLREKTTIEEIRKTANATPERMRKKYLNQTVESAKVEAEAIPKSKNPTKLSTRTNDHILSDVKYGLENWNTLSLIR